MRLCKVKNNGHGVYAEVLGIVDTPTGVKARLRFPDEHRELVSVTQIRILQPDDFNNKPSRFLKARRRHDII